jgi:hypothetical protein
LIRPAPRSAAGVRPKAGAACLAVLAAVAGFLSLGPNAAADDGRRKQEIVFAELPARTVTEAPFDIAAKATSGLAVALEVISGPAVLDGKKLRLTGHAGLVIIRASQQGDALFLPALPAERAFAVHPKPFPPAIFAQPAGGRVAIGAIVSLSAEASGEPAPTFQWRKDGVPVQGATDRRLTIAPAALSDSGDYDVVASNPLGSATSGPARVAVGRRGQTISFQSAAPATAGQPVILSASASSGLPVRFEVVSGAATLNASTLTAQAGTVVVQASQPGDSTYEAAPPVTQSFQVAAAAEGQHAP